MKVAAESRKGGVCATATGAKVGPTTGSTEAGSVPAMNPKPPSPELRAGRQIDEADRDGSARLADHPRQHVPGGIEARYAGGRDRQVERPRPDEAGQIGGIGEIDGGRRRKGLDEGAGEVDPAIEPGKGAAVLVRGSDRHARRHRAGQRQCQRRGPGRVEVGRAGVQVWMARLPATSPVSVRTTASSVPSAELNCGTGTSAFHR